MPSRGVKQPNGKYAIFSTMVDDFTAMNLTREELVEIFREDMGRRAADEKAQRADLDETEYGVHRDNDGLDRWREALSDVEMQHGKDRRDARERAGGGHLHIVK